MNVQSFFNELVQSGDEDLRLTQKQIDIMSAAVEIFAQKGYAATSTSEIAKRASVGEGTIFHHYKTKKDMLLAIPQYLNRSPNTRAYMEDLIGIFENPPEKFEDFLRLVVYNRRDFVLKNISLIKVLFQEVALHPELREKMAETTLFPATGKLLLIIDRFKAKGQIADVPGGTVMKLILTSLFGYFFTLYIAKLDFGGDNEKDLEYLIRCISHGLCIPGKPANQEETGL